jgi:hypothetical protein
MGQDIKIYTDEFIKPALGEFGSIFRSSHKSHVFVYLPVEMSKDLMYCTVQFVRHVVAT